MRDVPTGRGLGSRVFIPLLLLTCGAIMAMDRADPDLWGHIQYGREVLRDGGLPATSTWNYTAPGYRWINHENLAEIVMAATYDAFGTWGLSIGKFLLSLLVIALLIRQATEGNSGPKTDTGEWKSAAAWDPPRFVLHPLTVGFVAVVVALSVEFHWHFRPQVFGYACAAALMAVLSGSIRWQNLRCSGTRHSSGVPGSFVRSGSDPQAGDFSCAARPTPIGESIWFAVPILLVWANSHGSFIAGLCLLWSYAVLLSAELIRRSGRPALRDTVLLFSVASASTLATFLNPYGMRLHLWLWEALHIPRPEIWDWQPLELWSREAIGFWVIFATTAAATWMTYYSKDRENVLPADRLDWPKLAVLSLVGAQAVMHVRHLPLLAIIWGFWIQRPLNRFWQPFRVDVAERLTRAREIRGGRSGETEDSTTVEDSGTKTVSTGAGWSSGFSLQPGSLKAELQRRASVPLSLRPSVPFGGVPAVTALAICLWAGFIGTELGGRLSALKVDRDQYPVDAMAFMADHNLAGRTVVTFNWAQYAIGVFAAEGLDSTVAFDGRFRTCYPQEVIDTQFDFLFGKDYAGPRCRSPKSPPVDPTRALRSGDPELVLISRRQQPSVRTMQSVSKDWALLYQDGLAQVWGRRDIFDDSSNPRYLAVDERVIGDELAEGWVEWPAFPKATLAASAVVSRD